MSYTENFLPKLKIGEQTELMLMNYYQSRKYNVLGRRGKGNEYDLMIENPKTQEIKTFEVKTDLYVKERGQGGMFIEFECRGEKSGISTTQADKWVHYFFHTKQLWVTDVKNIRDLLEEYTFNTSYNSGDPGSNTKGYILECNEPDIKKYFEIKDVDLTLFYYYNKLFFSYI